MREIEKHLPEVLNKISIVREYNSLTGASLSHWDFDHLGIFERDDVILAIENSDLVQ